MAESKYVGFGSSSDLRLLSLSAWPNPSMFGLVAFQIQTYLVSTRDRIQVCYIWQVARSMFIWAQCIVELKFVGSGRSSRLCLLRLNSWPNSSMLGLVGRQIQVYLESKHDRTQVCWLVGGLPSYYWFFLE